MTVQNSTLSGNSATSAAAASTAALSTVTVQNSIVAAQTAGGGLHCGTLTSGGYNIESGTSCNFTRHERPSERNQRQPGASTAGQQRRADADAGAGAGSVAVDRIPVGALEANGCVAGTSTDQRDAPRAGGAGNGGSACDVGAYEDASTPLAVTLAGFDAQAMVDHIQLSWETVSEINNAGFNLYRSASPAAPMRCSPTCPRRRPARRRARPTASTIRRSRAGQTWYYWLEDVDLSGATSLHGPVSATLQAPTAVTLGALEAQAASPAAA